MNASRLNIFNFVRSKNLSGKNNYKNTFKIVFLRVLYDPFFILNSMCFFWRLFVVENIHYA